MLPQAPNMLELERYAVTRKDEYEAVYQPLYDIIDYPSSGATSLKFFSVPEGQDGKTIEDTNMTQANQLSAPNKFLIMALSVDFFIDGAKWNDNLENKHNVLNKGHLQLYIGTKPYLDDAPLLKFPPLTYLRPVASIVTADEDVRMGNVVGKPYEITPFLIEPSQNFYTKLTWKEKVAASDGRISVTLHGYMYRLSQ